MSAGSSGDEAFADPAASGSQPGYPDAFLAKNFRRAPSFTRRHNTLFSTSLVTKDNESVSALILPYSPGATKLTTGVLVDREGYLPTHLAKRRNVHARRGGSATTLINMQYNATFGRGRVGKPVLETGNDLFG